MEHTKYVLIDYKRKEKEMQEKHSSDSQISHVLNYMRTHDYITSMDAFSKYNITRLSSLIFILRKEGYDITSTAVRKNRKNYVEYRLNESNSDSRPNRSDRVS